MSGLPDYTMRVFFGGDQLPPEAVELFGHEVEDAWNRWRDGGDKPVARPVLIGASGDGFWLAGVYMLIEPGGEIASIRQLIVRHEFRSRGLAGLLLRRTHTAASSAGCKRIRSTAGWGCMDHIGMYDRMGYDQARGEAPYLVTKML